MVATNRRARHDYEILETLECGLVLTGSEVKSLREGKAQIAEGYARVDDGELWLFQTPTSRRGPTPWASAATTRIASASSSPTATRSIDCAVQTRPSP